MDLSKPSYAFTEEGQTAVCLYLFQNASFY